MARLKFNFVWASLLGSLQSCGRWGPPTAKWAPKSRAQKEVDAETRLKAQLRVQEAHITEALASISRSEREKATARVSGDRAGFEASVRERRRAVLQLKRYRQLESFSRRMLDSISDANLVRESVETLGQVKQAFAGAGMDKLIHQMQDTVGDLDDWKAELKGAQSLFQDPSRHGVNVGELDDDEMLKELDEFDMAAPAMAANQRTAEFVVAMTPPAAPLATQTTLYAEALA
jgi:hypothetical protein